MKSTLYYQLKVELMESDPISGPRYSFIYSVVSAYIRAAIRTFVVDGQLCAVVKQRRQWAAVDGTRSFDVHRRPV